MIPFFAITLINLVLAVVLLQNGIEPAPAGQVGLARKARGRGPGTSSRRRATLTGAGLPASWV